MKKERKKHLRRLRDRAEKRREARHRDTLEGVLRMAPGGYGFVRTVDAAGAEGEVFVPAKFVNGALDKDRVALEIMPPRPGHPEDSARGPVGRVTEILERTRDELVGEVLPGGVVRPLNTRLPESVRTIGPRAFADCPYLSFVFLSGAGADIAEDAFAGDTEYTVYGPDESGSNGTPVS